MTALGRPTASFTAGAVAQAPSSDPHQLVVAALSSDVLIASPASLAVHPDAPAVATFVLGVVAHAALVSLVNLFRIDIKCRWLAQRARKRRRKAASAGGSASGHGRTASAGSVEGASSRPTGRSSQRSSSSNVDRPIRDDSGDGVASHARRPSTRGDEGSSARTMADHHARSTSISTATATATVASAVPTPMRFASSHPTPDGPPVDPYNLVLVLDAFVLLFALAEFGKNLTFNLSSPAACSFLSAWSNIAYGVVIVLATARSFVEIRELGVAVWDYVLYGLLKTGLVASIFLLAITNISVLLPFPLQTKPPAPTPQVCSTRFSLLGPVLAASFALALSLYLLIRLHSHLAPAFLKFRSRLRVMRDWRTARSGSTIVLFVVTLITDLLATRGESVITFVVPRGTALLLVLGAFNQFTSVSNPMDRLEKEDDVGARGEKKRTLRERAARVRTTLLSWRPTVPSKNRDTEEVNFESVNGLSDVPLGAERRGDDESRLPELEQVVVTPSARSVEEARSRSDAGGPVLGSAALRASSLYVARPYTLDEADEAAEVATAAARAMVTEDAQSSVVSPDIFGSVVRRPPQTHPRSGQSPQTTAAVPIPISISSSAARMPSESVASSDGYLRYSQFILPFQDVGHGRARRASGRGGSRSGGREASVMSDYTLPSKYPFTVGSGTVTHTTPVAAAFPDAISEGDEAMTPVAVAPPQSGGDKRWRPPSLSESLLASMNSPLSTALVRDADSRPSPSTLTSQNSASSLRGPAFPDSPTDRMLSGQSSSDSIDRAAARTVPVKAPATATATAKVMATPPPLPSPPAPHTPPSAVRRDPQQSRMSKDLPHRPISGDVVTKRAPDGFVFTIADSPFPTLPTGSASSTVAESTSPAPASVRPLRVVRARKREQDEGGRRSDDDDDDDDDNLSPPGLSSPPWNTASPSASISPSTPLTPSPSVAQSIGAARSILSNARSLVKDKAHRRGGFLPGAAAAAVADEAGSDVDGDGEGNKNNKGSTGWTAGDPGISSPVELGNRRSFVVREVRRVGV